MGINTSKSQIVHFRNKRKIRTSFVFTYGDNKIDIVDKYKYLGIFLTEHFDYQYIAEVLTGAASRALGSIISNI